MTLQDFIDSITEDGNKWFPEVVENVPHTALGLVEEVGEVAGLVKKYERFTLNWNGLCAKAPEEIIDSFIYLLKLGAQLGMTGADFEKTYWNKRSVNEERFSNNPYRVRTRGRGNGHSE